MTRIVELNHPLAAHHLAILRNGATDHEVFRASVRRLTTLLTYPATEDLRLHAIEVQTPVGLAHGGALAERVAIVPILRAGLGMVEPLLSMLPQAEVRHLGVYRDEQTLQPVEYYHKLPKDDPPDVAIITDPMLATGGSSVWAIRQLRTWGVKRIKQLSLIAAPEGIAHVHEVDPDVQLYICCIDERLNDHGYIVPGLGDAGDRIFHT